MYVEHRKEKWVVISENNDSFSPVKAVVCCGVGNALYASGKGFALEMEDTGAPPTEEDVASYIAIRTIEMLGED